MKIPLFKVYTDEHDVKAVAQVIRSKKNWAIGPKIEEFEGAVAKFVGTKYALAFNSGTSALHALMLAYGFKKGDEIIVPSFTFIATANAVLFVGAKPVFAEVEDTTFGLDPDDVEKKITKKTKAIMAVHYGGMACQIEALKKIAKKHKLILIEDAAEALGSRVGNQRVGTFGDAAMFSLCGPKVITTGEGGLIVTNNRNLYEKMKLTRSHGRLETANYFTFSGHMDYVALGYNFRMSNITAALGLSQLKKIATVIAKRKNNAEYLTKKLSGLEEIMSPQSPKSYFHIYQMYTIKVKGGQKVRDALKNHLNKKGISTKIYFDPVHLSDFYKKSRYAKNLPITNKIASQVLTLPMYPDLAKQEMDYMAKEIASFFQKNGT